MTTPVIALLAVAVVVGIAVFVSVRRLQSKLDQSITVKVDGGVTLPSR